MKKISKVITMALAAITVTSALGVSAMAKIPIADNDGTVIGYEYTTDDLDDINVGRELAAQIPMACKLSNSAPVLGDTVNNLNKDYIETFSTSYSSIVYSELWTNSANPTGIRFYDIKNPNKLTIVIYRMNNRGGSSKATSITPAANSIGCTFTSLKSSNNYYMAVSTNGAQSGKMVITNSPSDYGLK